MATPEKIAAAHLNVNCIDVMLAKPKLSYDWLRFDSNDDCNLHCVYCHNSRSSGQLEPEQLQQFLTHNAQEIENFQFGCRMEPTLDPRLVEFMELLHYSAARPTRQVVLQTNATLLHRHDSARMMAAGLKAVNVSIDTIDEAVFAQMRGGAKIGKVLRNLERFKSEQPEVIFRFIVTVAKSNLHHVDELTAFAVSVGAGALHLREMMFFSESNVVDHEKMADLVLDEGEFASMVADVTARHGETINIFSNDKAGLQTTSRAVNAHSY